MLLLRVYNRRSDLGLWLAGEKCSVSVSRYPSTNASHLENTVTPQTRRVIGSTEPATD